MLNVFTGLRRRVTATTLLIQGNQKADLASIRGGGFILLFAFTYLQVAFNGYLNAGGRAFGWYCLFASLWLGANWFAWAVLWFLFFMLLALERPIARLTGLLAIAEGIGTSWVFRFLLFQGTVRFGRDVEDRLRGL